MPQENVEIVRRAWEYEMFGRGGEDAVAEFASDIVMNPVEEGPSYGRAAIRDNIQRFESAWDDLQVTAEQFIDAGDRVFVTAHFRGRGRASGITVETRLYEVYTSPRSRRLAGVGAPSRIRTCGLLLRRESLYPAELSGLRRRR